MKTKLAISYSISRIDTLINKQVKAIQQHIRFQELESSWRGLAYLIEEIANINDTSIKLRVLTISWLEISKDLSRAAEFDQSQLFIKIYSAEFGHPGGEPFGLLIGDYRIHHMGRNHFSSDIDTLRRLAKIAAAAFSPFVTSISPSLLGINCFSQLERVSNLELTFQQKEYERWHLLCKDEDTRFLGCVLPQILLRQRSDGYLWGNAVYCFAAVTARVFSQNGWFAEMRGTRQDALANGLVSGLVAHHDYITDICITEQLEKNLSDRGLIPLCECKYTPFAAFYDYPSLHKPNVHDRITANTNARISSQLNYMLCISRFAHYIKIITRDKVGTFLNPIECERYLQSWIRQYTASGDNLDPSMKAKYPLRETQIHVKEYPGKPGNYYCTIHIQPHGQLDNLEPYLTLTTELKNKH